MRDLLVFQVQFEVFFGGYNAIGPKLTRSYVGHPSLQQKKKLSALSYRRAEHTYVRSGTHGAPRSGSAPRLVCLYALFLGS